MKQWDILGLGCAAVDDLLYVESFPQPDGKTPVVRAVRQCGGLTATALVAAARLGARCAYGALLGHGPLSQYVEETLIKEGIDLDPVVRHPEADPVHSTIIVDTLRHTRSILFHIGGRTGAHDMLPGAELIRQAQVLFVDHYGMTGNLRAARIAHESGIPVVADLERQNVPHFAELLEWVDHLIVSADFARQLTGQANVAEAALQLYQHAQGTVVITCGDEGCIYHASGYEKPVHRPAFKVAVADTTGCGDVFHGAYAAALAQSMDLEERIRLASAAAAIKATHEGGQAGIPNRATVEAFLRKRDERL
ncbi:MAG: hypothetical protein JO316_15025 [Abitibacteriaceae bacterium]|nr:hypothetical protein [Abditibacteriaceae bacterium]